jgi:D-alanyl-D-alanine carboxypeptidase
MLLNIVLVIWIDRCGRYLCSNRKRLIGIGLSVMVFMVSNSFATPSFQSQEIIIVADEAGQDEQQETGQGELAADAQESEEELAEGLETLEDVDSYTEDEDMYSVDEILQSSASQEILDSQVLEQIGDGDFSKDDWNLLLVNKQHPIPDDYSFELGEITQGMRCDARILPELFAMLQAAKDDGVNLVVCSPYRDIALQDVLFNRKIKLYMGRGYSYMEAYKKASQVVTVPGASEHQIGLALDIICDTYSDLNAGFGDTAAGIWLREHSKEYGFILRYPEGKEYITGITYEPWHFRYVGKEAATLIMDNDLSLEEFIEDISE